MSRRSIAAIEVVDPRAAALVRHGATLEQLATGAAWSEGPVWLRDEDAVLWSDIPNNRILRWSAGEGLSVWRNNANFTNGHALEADGSLLHCSHGLRAIVRTRFSEGTTNHTDEILVDSFQGRRLNSPNDVIVKRDGTVWFSDPPYGIRSDAEGHRAESEQKASYIFRYDPATSALDIATDFLDEPNGLAFSPDEMILYVSDTSAASRPDGQHHIVAFDVIDGRTLTRPRIFAEITPGLPDGFRVDSRGWIFTSSADSVQVIHPDGTLLARIPIPEKVGNLVFGGLNGNELYICASTSLYRIALETHSQP